MHQKWHVCIGSFTWQPVQKREHERDWFQLGKWDRGFTRFVTEKALDLRKGKRDGQPMDVIFFSELKQKCLEAIEAAINDLWEDENSVKKSRKLTNQALKRAANQSHLPFIVVDLPAIEYHLDEEVTRSGPLQMRVLNENIGSSLLWVELTAENLQYLRCAIMSSQPKPKATKRKSREMSSEAESDGGSHANES